MKKLNNTENVQKLQELENKLNKKLNEYKEITLSYIKNAEKLEDAKISLIDPAKRDSVEKQMMAAMKLDEDLKKLFLNTETLRRQKDVLLKEIDVLKTLFDINKNIFKG